MMFKTFVNIGITLTAFLMVILTIATLSVFAMNPTESILFTNTILLVLTLVQLLGITVLLHIYDLLDGRKERRRRK